MIMKRKKNYSWVLRVSNPFTGEVEYHIYMYLTAAEIRQEAVALVSDNRELYVAIFKLYDTL